MAKTLAEVVEGSRLTDKQLGWWATHSVRGELEIQAGQTAAAVMEWVVEWLRQQSLPQGSGYPMSTALILAGSDLEKAAREAGLLPQETQEAIKEP